jgi:ATP-dependent Clp protease protease subunit
MTAQPGSPDNEVFAVFCGLIDQAAVQRIFQGVTAAINTGVTHLHLLFQSTGGFVGDGVCLYNFFRSLPLSLTLYNAGAVQSIAAIAYLGAKKRQTSAHASFMIHRTYTQQLATASRLQAAAKSLILDDQRTEAILREHLRLPDDRWKEFDYHDLVFSGREAVTIGLADEIGEFSPKTAQVFNL